MFAVSLFLSEQRSSEQIKGNLPQFAIVSTDLGIVELLSHCSVKLKMHFYPLNCVAAAPTTTLTVVSTT